MCHMINVTNNWKVKNKKKLFHGPISTSNWCFFLITPIFKKIGKNTWIMFAFKEAPIVWSLRRYVLVQNKKISMPLDLVPFGIYCLTTWIFRHIGKASWILFYFSEAFVVGFLSAVQSLGFTHMACLLCHPTHFFLTLNEHRPVLHFFS